MLEPETLRALTDIADAAQQAPLLIGKMASLRPAMTIDEGYAVQDALLERWLHRGRTVVGMQIGLTIDGLTDGMAKFDSTFGNLMGDALGADESAWQAGTSIRLEAQLAFVTKSAIGGPDVTVPQVLAATDFVQPAVRIRDTRYASPDIGLGHVIAANGFAARFVLGGRARRPEEVDLRTVGIVLEKNGETVGTSSSGAVLGHPAKAVQKLVGCLHERGRVLPAGSIVGSGSATTATPVVCGDVIFARFEKLGSISLRRGA
jgi:2-oxo-3-hexenedioate decarboxylase